MNQNLNILKQKLASNPNSPKAQKWKRIISNIERDMQEGKEFSKSKTSRSALSRDTRLNIDSVLDVEQSKIRMEYLHTCLYPDNYSYRMPDEVTQPTMLYKSIREFNLMCNLDGSINSGRFSFAVKPILGSTGSRHNYQVGIVDSSGGWPNPSLYDSDYIYSNSNLYSDPRVDPMIQPLTGPPAAYKSSKYSCNIPALATHTYTSFIVPDISATVKGNLMVETLVLPASSLVFNAYDVLGGTVFTILPPSGLVNICLLGVTSGVYYLSSIFNVYGTFSATGAQNQVMINAFTKKDKTYAGSYITQSGAASIVTGVFTSTTNNINDFDGNIYNTNQGLLFDERQVFRLSEDYLYSISCSVINTAVSSVTVGYVIATTTDPSLPTVSNSGSVVRIRPIGLSCLVTNTLPDINAGGNIVAYSAPSSDVDNYYYETSAQLGPFQEWENLARTNKGKLLHDGNFKMGAYVWTQPWDKNDTLMRTPTEANDYQYQGIIVSGQINPSVGLNGMVNAGRIRIAIVYEYTTDNRLFTPESCLGATSDLDWVLGYLGSQSHAYENPDHLAKIKNVVKKGASFVSKSVPYIVKAAETSGKIASLFL